MMDKKTISILGCGWYGQALGTHLVKKGSVVKGSTTKPSKLSVIEQQGIHPYLIDLHKDEINSDFFKCDILIVASGAEVGELARYCTSYGVQRIIYISSTGVYGGGEVDEHSLPDISKPHYIAERKLARAGLSVIRFAGLVGPGRMPGRFLAGKKDLPNGSAPVNLIHLDDCIGLTEAVMARPELDLVNGVSPDHPSRKDFYQLASAHEGLIPPEFSAIEGEYKLVRSRYSDLYQYKVTNWMECFTSL